MTEAELQLVHKAIHSIHLKKELAVTHPYWLLFISQLVKGAAKEKSPQKAEHCSDRRKAALLSYHAIPHSTATSCLNKERKGGLFWGGS